MTVASQRIAIIGAGLAGLTCARRLVAAGLEVHLFDKSRGAGGRMCTRRAEEVRFDHGAQYFTATDSEFQAEVSRWATAGVVAEWTGQFGLWEDGALRPDPDPRPRWVAQPRMSALGRFLGEPLDVRLRARVTSMVPAGRFWAITTEDGTEFSGYQAVLLSCPAPQVEALVPAQFAPSILTRLPSYAPCWAVMVEYPTRVSCPYDGIRFSKHDLGWAARDSSKPGRMSGERWVLHGSPDWSAVHLEDEKHEVEQALLHAFTPLGAQDPGRTLSHRWRYALAHPPEPPGVSWSSATGIGIFGDGWVAPKVEGAWRSGVAMADAVLADVG